MLPDEETQRQQARDLAKKRLLRKKSYQCPVYLKINNVFEHQDPLDMRHAVELMRIELRSMPEGAATMEILSSLLKLEDAE